MKAFDDITTLIGGWDGFQITSVRREAAPATAPAEVVIELAAVPECVRRCSRCGTETREVHDLTVRRIRELPILDATTWLLVPLARVRRPQCGRKPTTEALPWLDRYARMTKRFAESVARLAQGLPIHHVAAWFGLSWDTVKLIDQRALSARLGSIGLAGVRQIAIDEFAIQKASTVVDPTTRRVLWVGRGRAREDLRPFFELLGPEGCAGLEVAVMDMSEAYELETKAHCPRAVIVSDLFHVVAKYGREVVDRVRVDEARRHARDRTMQRVIKGARWLLLRNKRNVWKRRERLHLRDLLTLNRRLWVVYVLKDSLKRLWHYRYPGAAARAWREWYGWAMRSRSPALVTFARNLKAKLPGILAHCRYLLHTGLLEGLNNKIKVLTRMAYGFRDDAYFFLEIRAAFPGNP